MTKQPENIHSATDPQKCREIARKYRWKLKAIRPTGDPILNIDCVFEGQQISDAVGKVRLGFKPQANSESPLKWT